MQHTSATPHAGHSAGDRAFVVFRYNPLMRRILRGFSRVVCVLSVLLCVAVCVFWVRGLTGRDQIEWRYNRWLPDMSAASNGVYLTSDKRLWAHALWGKAPPSNGNLVYGYYLNADSSGGKPQWRVTHAKYAKLSVGGVFGPVTYDSDSGTRGWGPLRWSSHRRVRPKDGDDFQSIQVGVSHWLVALVLLAPPTVWVTHLLMARRSRTRGLCLRCGYDLRATPQRCPECGMEQRPIEPKTALA
jgi:hypothetical protein